MVISLGCVSLLLLKLTCLPVLRASRPNIVVVLADDLGWGDVGWNNEAMVDVTQSLTRLAREGVRLTQYYVQQVCTPSRSALLTGMYPYHIGRQKRALKGRLSLIHYIILVDCRPTLTIYICCISARSDYNDYNAMINTMQWYNTMIQ